MPEKRFQAKGGRRTKQPVRLYSKGVLMGPKRSKCNTHMNQALVKIEGVHCTEDVDFYLGKRIAYVYKTNTLKNGSKFRCMWGKVMRAHGNAGTVRCNFKKNLPPKAYGSMVRVMLYPSRV
ncbi:60S ribosomal protein L35A [Perkinsus olseni]|uniref:60S ribosomal protein L35A n=2 Tax=Perkinsus TaxID=28000 RepID=A0A7J6L7N4_PEROL|nr:60S ribosomal protein L35A [Perkinsus olseni]KAF4655218.1 60S ribosomal protein L35A [Perkinsus olseni]KAF4659550.1 60S ribosomal protein L35A [Perkinsus chesapeaki]KAF4694326.1 60S ribosomal protein L35A [Perkinsus olseni]KAF4719864.1 60S ribosomal protein L35A [Perkinsus olseni]